MSQQVMIYCLENVLYLRCEIIRAYHIPAAWMIAALRKRTSWQRINVQILMEN